jgi:hypothetical protein
MDKNPGAVLLFSLAALLAAPVSAQTVSLPLGPAFDLVIRQVPDLEHAEKRTGDPEIKTWVDRRLRITDEVDPTRPAGDPEIKMVLLVRRTGDEAAAVAAARTVLGPALALHVDERRNCVTIDEYLEHVAETVAELKKQSKSPIVVDYGALRAKIRADLTGVKGALYILRAPDPS